MLDTWFSSALWPFSTMGWPDETELLQTFYPTSCLVTGFDILFFWVARMMMMGLKFMDDVPFRDVYIHALVRDELGKKMSKSLGNVIDPLEVMDRYGTDAFRFTLAALAAQGRDIRLSEIRHRGVSQFHEQDMECRPICASRISTARQRPLPSEFRAVSLCRNAGFFPAEPNHTGSASALETYLFNDAAQALYHFTWHEFCDWYIEEAKIPLSGDDLGQKRARAVAVLRHVLDALMRLLHPFIPFITEEIAAKIHGGSASIMPGPFPGSSMNRDIDPVAEKSMGVLMGVITSVRNIRAEMNLPPGRALPVIVLPSSDEERTPRSKQINPWWESWRRINGTAIGDPPNADIDPPRMSATAVVE